MLDVAVDLLAHVLQRRDQHHLAALLQSLERRTHEIGVELDWDAKHCSLACGQHRRLSHHLQEGPGRQQNLAFVRVLAEKAEGRALVDRACFEDKDARETAPARERVLCRNFNVRGRAQESHFDPSLDALRILFPKPLRQPHPVLPSVYNPAVWNGRDLRDFDHAADRRVDAGHVVVPLSPDVQLSQDSVHLHVSWARVQA
mmetsp:Transcript_58375/g.137027  ORF Transcript_58375/g.137027 Transcript_58375/m.137027 type:complete len:201 (+) Transcript_58375:1130-1732(+)